MSGPIGWDDLTDDLRERIERAEARLEVVEDGVTFFQARERGIKMVLGATTGAVVFIGSVLALAQALRVI